MSGIIGVFDRAWPEYDKKYLTVTINPISAHTVKEKVLDSGFIIVSFLDNKPLKGSYYYEDKHRILCFAGDSITATELSIFTTLPWYLRQVKPVSSLHLYNEPDLK